MPKVILISGGSDGLGKALAKKLTPNHQVVILAHNREKLESAARELNCDFVEAELTDFDSLKTAVDQVLEKYHQIDVLVNNAGVWMEGDLTTCDPQKIKEVIDINTTGTIFLTKTVLPYMEQNNTGQIINIISQDGLTSKKSHSVYCASKWAITGFTKCLQEDLEGESIRVTGIYPGLINTLLFAKTGAQRDLSNALDPVEVASLVEYVINLGQGTNIPDISIANQVTKNKMDITSAPPIDLNIDPDMITPQGDSPQPLPGTSPTPSPAPALVSNPNIIDITPGSPTPPPPAPQVSPPIQNTPIVDQPVAVPSYTPPDSLSHLADLAPEPLPEPAQAPVSEPMTMPVTPEPFTEPPLQATPALETPSAPVSPLAEDPDLVKLVN